MPRKSNNKTSYVMNLITNGEEEQQGQESQNAQNEQGGQDVSVQAFQEGQNTQNIPAAQASAPGVPPEAEIKKVVVVDEEQESERLSEEIRSQLELQLEAELKEQADTAEAQSPELAAAQTEPIAKQEPGQPFQGTEASEQKTMEAVNTSAEAGYTALSDTAATETEIVESTMDTEMNTAAAAEISNATTQSTQPGYRMVNVMETLVARVDLDKYIKEYGVCPCPRCRADVHALILTTLPSKYVVMDEAAISPMLNFYESRRKTDIFTATLKACLEVKENPRHEREAGQ